MTLRTLQNFYKETIAVNCSTGATNIYVSTKPTASTGYLVISPGSTTLREIVRYSATGTDGTGDYVTIADVADRGIGGTTEQEHIVGEVVSMNYVAEHYSEVQDELDLKIDLNYLDTDDTLAADSDVKIPSQQAVKAYIDTGLATKVAKTGAESISGIKTFTSSPIVPTPTTDYQAATKEYADGLAFSGAPNANETSKGLVEEATSTEVTDGDATGETGASLFVTPAKLLELLRGAVDVTVGTTHSLTTDGNQKVLVFAKGDVSGVSAASVYLKYNSITKDTVNTHGGNNTNARQGFALMYTEIPAAGTYDITVTTTTSVANVVIVVVKL